MDKVTLNKKEQKRLLVMNEVLAGRVTGQEAAEMLGLPLRHTRRMIAANRQAGAAALAHGSSKPTIDSLYWRFEGSRSPRFPP
jgi:predicted DNA-binding transcriptional regulator YafY